METAKLSDDPLNETKREQLENAEKALREALKAAKPSAEAQAVAEAEALIEKAENLPSDETLQEVLTQLEVVFGSQLATTLQEISTGIDTTSAEVSEPLAAALGFIGAAYAVRDAKRVRPSETANALLIGIAKIRHELNMLDVEVSARRLDREIVLQQTDALRQQLYYLAQAQDALCGASPPTCRNANKQAFSESLSFYARSFNVGYGPNQILASRRLQLQRATSLKRAKATEADYRTLIQPAIDQLAAYYAGGIKSETIGEFLASLPTVGAVVVK